LLINANAFSVPSRGILSEKGFIGGILRLKKIIFFEKLLFYISRKFL